MTEAEFQNEILKRLAEIERKSNLTIESMAMMSVGLSSQIVAAWNVASATSRNAFKDRADMKPVFDKVQEGVLAAAEMLKSHAIKLMHEVPQADRPAEFEVLLKKNDMVH